MKNKNLNLPVTELYELLQNFPSDGAILISDEYEIFYPEIKKAVKHLVEAFRLINDVETAVSKDI